MQRNVSVSAVLTLLLASEITPIYASENNSYSAVDVFVGTGDSQASNPVPGGKGGSTQPAATLPFGMIQWGPDTDHPESSGYRYDDSKIAGFSLTHLSGAGCGNGGELPILSYVGDAQGVPISFSHDHESAAPGFYQVTLDNGVSIELTVSDRSGIGRFVFPDSHAHGLWIAPATAGSGSAKPTLSYPSDHEISGTIVSGDFCGSGKFYPLHFYVEFDSDFRHSGSALAFDAANVTMKVGISYVSEANARANLGSEIPGWDFDLVHASARARWESALSAIRVDSPDPVFYTALYHALLHPSRFDDVSGENLGLDGKIHAYGHPHYSNFSGWDVYRSEMQLLAILFPDRASDMARSLIEDAQECGAIPKWLYNNDETGVMVGDPGVVILSDLQAFGASFDFGAALAQMKRNALEPGAACNGMVVRPSLALELKLGYLPLDAEEWGPAATTLEYATADFAFSRFALRVGEDALSRSLITRSAFWKNLWDDSTKRIRPKQADGSWLAGFHSSSMEGFVEGSASQYSWMIPFDLVGVISRLGGATKAADDLDAFFSELNAGTDSDHAYLGNEPSMNTPWHYLWMQAPARSQALIRKIQATLYKNTPGGLPGNDDLGAMSSWYVWSALGLYPAIPGEGGFVLGAPAFASIQITPENRNPIAITSGGASLTYIQNVHVGGRAQTSTWLDWRTFSEARRLDFQLSDKPSDWGTHPEDAPPSFEP